MANITESLINDVIKGKYGTGAKRKANLTNAGYDPTTVQNFVNQRLKGIDISAGLAALNPVASVTPVTPVAVPTVPTTPTVSVNESNVMGRVVGQNADGTAIIEGNPVDIVVTGRRPEYSVGNSNVFGLGVNGEQSAYIDPRTLSEKLEDWSAMPKPQPTLSSMGVSNATWGKAGDVNLPKSTDVETTYIPYNSLPSGLTRGENFAIARHKAGEKLGTFGTKVVDGAASALNGWDKLDTTQKLSAIGGTVKGIYDMYNNYKMMKMAKQQMNWQMDMYNKQFENQRRLTNSQLYDRQARRVAEQPHAHMSVSDYMNKYGV